MYRKILVAMALDHGVSPKTLEIARSLRKDGGEIIALHVHEAPSGTAGAYLDTKVVRASFEKSRELLAEKIKGLDGVKAELVKGHTYRSIIDYANSNGVDCIVIGSHKPGLSDYLLGSTAARVVRHAPCAVHVYRSQ